MSKQVSVVITTYNRLHDVLRLTIPSYLDNACVGEIIIVDDASPISPETVILELQAVYPQIKYIRKALNAKLPAARNTGIKNAQYQYIHFGDDDNILMPKAIDLALKTLIEFDADVVGIRPLLLESMNEYEHLGKFLQKCDSQKGELVDMKKLKFNFFLNPQKIQEVPVCHSACLMKASLARKVLFDENILGNAYREETDFFVRAKAIGAKIMFNPFIYTLNLPRDIATGGCHSGPKYGWYIWAIKNNWYFLNKNKLILRDTFGIKSSVYIMQFYFIWDFFKRFCKKIIRKIFK